MSIRNFARFAVLLLLALAVSAAEQGVKTTTVKGYVIDSACSFTKNLKKPVSPECALACAKAGSPMVILAQNGTIYWPIADTTPSTSQNDRLLPFAGKQVSVTGKVYRRGGSSAIVISKVEPLAE